MHYALRLVVETLLVSLRLNALIMCCAAKEVILCVALGIKRFALKLHILREIVFIYVA